MRPRRLFALRSVRALWHRSLGRFWFLLRQHERSRRRFRQALAASGDDYLAHLFLGRIAYALGDYQEWRFQVEQARRVAPHRLAETKPMFDRPVPRAAGALLERTERNRKQSQQGTSGLAAWQASDLIWPPPMRHDDFLSNSERQHLRALPPIEPAQLANVDWETLVRQLTAEQRPH